MSETFTKRLLEIRGRIREACLRSNRDPSSVRCVGVTKTISIERIAEAFREGQVLFGENYVQEALPKVKALPEAEWHFVGQLQSNKAKEIVRAGFSMLHSLDRSSLAEELEKRCLQEGRTLSVLIEANLAGETTKGGVPRSQLAALATFVRKNCHSLRLQGLMTFPPPNEDPRPHFRDLFHLRDELQQILGGPLEHLSMGISGDFETAIEEGATLIRLGTILFGERQ